MKILFNQITVLTILVLSSILSCTNNRTRDSLCKTVYSLAIMDYDETHRSFDLGQDSLLIRSDKKTFDQCANFPSKELGKKVFTETDKLLFQQYSRIDNIFLSNFVRTDEGFFVVQVGYTSKFGLTEIFKLSIDTVTRQVINKEFLSVIVE